ncbi:MAG: N-acetylmuramoyl-L-alanine amidase [Anaerolineae bacterium]|jgi:N-acetylmuramoyl-L-alanine amidase|nr:N-acetylmuramoyl-L-alanine amidase [Anaerolineae bacterium]
MKKSAESDPWAMGLTMRALVLVAVFAALLVPAGLVPIVAVATGTEGVAEPGGSLVVIPLSTATPVATPVTEFTPTPTVPRVGIIAGHTGSDSGAVCDDGLQEVTINTDVARQVVTMLTARGWLVTQLEEFDSRLTGYQADALVSIHADSCTLVDRSGFKVARAELSSIPDAEDRLIGCLSRLYAERTGLPFDPFTITYDMRRYHALYEIDPNTPAAIIEIGFMSGDRELLTERSEIVARGIADGLVCFIEGESR